jgi:hypothetical protein
MKGLGSLAQDRSVLVQSHLSESKGEIEWVKDLHPDHSSYTDVCTLQRSNSSSPAIARAVRGSGSGSGSGVCVCVRVCVRVCVCVCVYV